MWKALADRIQSLDERVNALERENEALRAEALEIDRSPQRSEKTRQRSEIGGLPHQSVSELAFQRLVRRLAPLPLKRVYEFRFDLSDTFWTKRLGLTEEERAFLQNRLTRLEYLTIEKWQSHTVIRTSVQAVSDQNGQRVWGSSNEHVHRIYPTGNGHHEYTNLWHLYLNDLSLRGTPKLVLRLEHTVLMLFAVHGRFGESPVLHQVDPVEQNVLLVVPLDAKQLAQFKRPDDSDNRDDPNFEEPWNQYKATPALTCYDGGDQETGISWTLWIHDLEAARDSGHTEN